MPGNSSISSGASTIVRGHRPPAPPRNNGSALVPRESLLRPPDELGLVQGSRLRVSEDIAGLLRIDGRVVELDRPAAGRSKAAASFEPLFSAPARARRAEQAPAANIDLVPENDRRYMNMTKLALLQEVAQRALGFGPPDVEPRDNPDAPLASRRLSDMTYALHFQPGRERDILVLRNAGLALDVFFIEYEKLVGRIRAARPDLQPAIEAWSKDFVRPALEKALQLPLGDDGQPQLNGGLYGDIDRTLDQSIESIIADLDHRMDESSPPYYAAKLDRFFERISAPREPGVPFLHGIEGAPGNEMKGSVVRHLVTGNLYIRSQNRQELSEYLRMLPAAQQGQTMVTDPRSFMQGYRNAFRDPSDSILLRNEWPVGMFDQPQRPPTFVTAYFFPTRDGIALGDVVWLSPDGPVHAWVAIRNGVHSFSLNRGVSWQPTGASASAHLDDARAAAWARFIQRRRQETGVRPIRPWDPEAIATWPRSGGR